MIYWQRFKALEASHSGLVQRVANPRYRKMPRGFESLRFRTVFQSCEAGIGRRYELDEKARYLAKRVL